MHEKGGRIYHQIWHGGRAVHPNHVNGLQTYGPSAIAIPTTVHTKNGREDHVAPKACTKEDRTFRDLSQTSEEELRMLRRLDSTALNCTELMDISWISS